MEKDKKEKSKGKLANYNKIPVKQRDYYYDRETTDKELQKDFGDMLADLKDMNKKMKREADRKETPKLNIDISETLHALHSKSFWANNVIKAKKEFSKYTKAGGKLNFESFLKAAIKAIKDGKQITSGSDLV